MKQKIVIKLQMDCDKCRNKALKIAAQVPGVTSVSLDGDDNDHVAVTGVNVNTVCLFNMLQKKFSSVIILTVEDMIKAAEAKKKKEDAAKKKEEEDEKKRKEKEEKLKKLLCSVMCKKCNSSNCHGKCEGTICSECLSINCGGKCEIFSVECEKTNCVSECKCQSSKCNGCSKPPSTCSKCNCGGKCEKTNCVSECKCQSSKCNGCSKPPSTCRKGCNCSKCYATVPYQSYQPCYYPYPSQPVYYDSCPDSGCSIM